MQDWFVYGTCELHKIGPAIISQLAARPHGMDGRAWLEVMVEGGCPLTLM